MKRTWITVASLAALAVGGAVWAGPWDGPAGRGKGGCKDHGAALGWLAHNPQAARELGITEEQVSALREQGYESRKEMIRLRSDLEMAELELRRLLESESPSTKDVDAAIERVGQAHTAMQKQRLHGMLKAREVLGEETCARLREKAGDAMRERRREFRGDRQGWKRGPRRAWGPEPEAFEPEGPGDVPDDPEVEPEGEPDDD
jgi:Spy/CpxP family protein refolding chaperone